VIGLISWNRQELRGIEHFDVRIDGRDSVHVLGLER